MVDKILKIKNVKSDLAMGCREALMCKIQWLPETREVVRTDANGRQHVDHELLQPEPCYVPISIAKQKCPLKLLDFYEAIYFGP